MAFHLYQFHGIGTLRLPIVTCTADRENSSFPWTVECQLA